MALILKKESPNRRWYKKNKQQLSEKRKKQYAEDLEYRQRAKEASRKYRRGERTLTTPPDGLISFAKAAEHIGRKVSTLYEWRSKKYFPEPKRHNARRLWFSEKQVLLLTKLKEVIRVYGKRRGNVKRDRLKEVIAFIVANWD
jgi:predicted DNA-binding transcriptional regulator AlpA